MVIAEHQQMRKVTQEIIASYQSRISEVAAIIDNTRQILEGFRARRDQMSNQLKETLAKEESLRRKDFDKMMRDILSYQDEREEEVKALLRTFFQEQKEIAEILRKNLTEGEKVKIGDFKKMLVDIQVKQKAREMEVNLTLRKFQQEYREMVESLRSLLNKGEAIRIDDFKQMQRSIRSRQLERTANIMAEDKAVSVKGGAPQQEKEVVSS